MQLILKVEFQNCIIIFFVVKNDKLKKKKLILSIEQFQAISVQFFWIISDFLKYGQRVYRPDYRAFVPNPLQLGEIGMEKKDIPGKLDVCMKKFFQN